MYLTSNYAHCLGPLGKAVVLGCISYSWVNARQAWRKLFWRPFQHATQQVVRQWAVTWNDAQTCHSVWRLRKEESSVATVFISQSKVLGSITSRITPNPYLPPNNMHLNLFILFLFCLRKWHEIGNAIQRDLGIQDPFRSSSSRKWVRTICPRLQTFWIKPSAFQLGVERPYPLH